MPLRCHRVARSWPSSSSSSPGRRRLPRVAAVAEPRALRPVDSRPSVRFGIEKREPFKGVGNMMKAALFSLVMASYVPCASAQVPQPSNGTLMTVDQAGWNEAHPNGGPPNAPSDPGADFLDSGIVFRGPVSFDRKKDFTQFTVHDQDAMLLLTLDTPRAFTLTPNTSISYQFAQKFTRAQHISVRIADLRDMPIGTTIAADSLEDVVTCLRPSPVERTKTDMLFTLSCFAFDEPRRLRTDAGHLFVELGFAVSVVSGSAAEQFLSKPREKVLYVRLEAGQ